MSCVRRLFTNYTPRSGEKKRPLNFNPGLAKRTYFGLSLFFSFGAWDFSLGFTLNPKFLNPWLPKALK